MTYIVTCKWLPSSRRLLHVKSQWDLIFNSWIATVHGYLRSTVIRTPSGPAILSFVEILPLINKRLHSLSVAIFNRMCIQEYTFGLSFIIGSRFVLNFSKLDRECPLSEVSLYYFLDIVYIVYKLSLYQWNSAVVYIYSKFHFSLYTHKKIIIVYARTLTMYSM